MATADALWLSNSPNPGSSSPKREGFKKSAVRPGIFLKEIAVRLVQAGDFTMLAS
jgi:hypothetical protein